MPQRSCPCRTPDPRTAAPRWHVRRARRRSKPPALRSIPRAGSWRDVTGSRAAHGDACSAWRWAPTRAVLAAEGGVGEVLETCAVEVDRAEVVVSARAVEGAHEEQAAPVG